MNNIGLFIEMDRTPYLDGILRDNIHVKMTQTMPDLETAFPMPGSRIVIVGAAGCGKTTTARQLARILGLPHVELDALYWQPNWVSAELEPFRQGVAQALSGPRWVTGANYSKAIDVIWGSATTVVWLDYALPVILWQLTGRTLKRIITREALWNGNRETLRGTFMSKDSILLWSIKSFTRQRQRYPRFFALPEYAHLQVIHLRSRKETGEWLQRLEEMD